MTDLTKQQASRHAVYVQRFAGHLANLFDPYLIKLQREIKVLMSDSPEGLTSIKQINSLLAKYKKEATAIYGEYNTSVFLTQLKELAGDEAAWQATMLDDAIKSAAINPVLASPAQAWATVLAEPLVFPDSAGVKLLKPFIKDWGPKQIEKVSDIIKLGFITGKSNQQIVQDVAGKNGYLANQSQKSIKAMVRTATNHTSSMARQATFDANSDIVIGYEWVSTLDARTSSICKGLDGKIYKPNDKDKRYPPAHINCRSSTSPVLDARYGLDDTITTRSSKGGDGREQVNTDTTYYGWVKSQGSQGPKGRAFVLDTLGQERGKLFLDGGLTADKFKQLTLDEMFMPIPLDVLRKKQSLQLAFDEIKPG